MYLAATDQASGIGALGLDIKSVIFQMIAFVLVVLVLKKFALNKLLAVIDARRDELKAGLDRSEAAKLELANATKGAEAIYARARDEAEVITANARDEAEGLATAIEKKAHEKAARADADAREQLAQDTTRVRQELKVEAARLVASATGVVLDGKLDTKRDSELIDDAITQVSRP